MAQISKFIDIVQGILVADIFLATKGITYKNVYRQFLPQVKDPPAPHLALAYEVLSTDVGLNIDKVKLYVGVHTSEFIDAYEMQPVIQALLHGFQHADAEVIVYKCFNVGGPTVPYHDKVLNHWECTLEFDCEIGDA